MTAFVQPLLLHVLRTKSAEVTTGCTARVFSRLFTTAYSGEPGDGRLGLEKLSYLPFRTCLPLAVPSNNDDTFSPNNSTKSSSLIVEVGPFEENEISIGRNLMNDIIEEGRSWPFIDLFETDESFAGYFLSHTALRVIATSVNDTKDSNISSSSSSSRSSSSNFMGMFYIKPNFPGRCSHICNGGFITAPAFRRRGVARLMGHVFLQAAHDLGYRSSYFNLVFASNQPSVNLWESLGMERVATLHEAADLKGVPGLDTAYGYRYDLTNLPEQYLWKHVTIMEQ